jgi:hypothetical protein
MAGVLGSTVSRTPGLPGKVIRQPPFQAAEEFERINFLSADDKMKVIVHQRQGQDVDVHFFRDDGDEVDRHLAFLFLLKDKTFLERLGVQVIIGAGFTEQLFLHPFDLPLAHRRPFCVLLHFFESFVRHKRSHYFLENNGFGRCFSTIFMILMILCAFLTILIAG